MSNEEAKTPEPVTTTEADGKTDGRQMVRAAGVVSFMTIISRILGLWRDRLMAAAFGASWVNDAFQIAFLLPNITRRLFGEGALASAFVPVFSERIATNRKEAAFRTASVLISRLAVGLTLGRMQGGLEAGLPPAGHHPVGLPAEEACESVKTVLAGFHTPRRTLPEVLPGLTPRATHFRLAYLPFRGDVHDYVQPQSGLSVGRSVLAQSRNL